MGIYQKTPQKEVEAYLKQELNKIERVVLNVLNRVGMLVVSEAKNNPGYMDQTGNLRSSIGYAVLRNGVVDKKSTFQQVKNGTEGKREGNSFINELAKKYGTGLVLIVVAGMEYAAYVETKRNVLASSELLAQQLVPNLLAQLGFKRK